jgi:hypothetical protein
MLTLAKIPDKKWQAIAACLPARWAPEDVVKKFEKLGKARSPSAAGAAWVATVEERDGNTSGLWILRPEGAAPVKSTIPTGSALRLHDVSPDGKHLLVAASEDIYQVAVATLAWRTVYTLPTGAWARAAVHLGGDRAVILHGTQLELLDTTGETWRKVASLALDGEQDLTAVRDRTILLTTPDGMIFGRPAIAYAVKEGFEELGRTDSRSQFRSGADELDGRVFVTDSKWKRHELLGLPGAPARPAAVSPDDYLFFGESPDDWHEGANLGHAYELVFREPPSKATKVTIAKLFTKKTSKGLVEGSPTPWLWSGRFALFLVGERRAGGDKFFDAMRGLIDAIHAAAPLAEARFRGMTAEKATYPRAPTPGPRWPGWDFRGTTSDPALPAGAPDEEFEKARKKS